MKSPSMDDLQQSLQKLASIFEVTNEKEILERAKNKRLALNKSFAKERDELMKELNSVLRENGRLEADLLRLKKEYKDVSDSNNFFVRARLAESKKLIKLEESIGEKEAFVEKSKERQRELDDIMKRSAAVTSEYLFYEIMKGFNVEIVDKGCLKAIVKSKKRNDCLYIQIDGRPLAEVSNEIWDAVLS